MKRASILAPIAALIAVPAIFITLEFTTPDVLPENSDGSAVAQAWMGLMLELTEETFGFTPPVAARAFAYAGVSHYESVRFSIPGAQSLAGKVNGFDESFLSGIDVSGTYDWDIVANANLAEMARALYPNVLPKYAWKRDKLERALHERYAAGVDEKTITDSVALGRAVAQGVATYAASDGKSEAHRANFPKTYVPPVGDGLWVPTPRAFKRAMQPGWGDVRPFLTDNIAGTMAPPPPSFSTDPQSRFFKEVEEAYETARDLTKEQEAIAYFWSDEPMKTATPAGHSISILMQVLDMEDASRETGAVAFAKMGMALHDSFVACWKAKYTYNLVRPVTVIREHIDPEFDTLLDTPPFPEYPSGHSVQSAAAAEVLTDLFGEDYAFVDSTHHGRADMPQDVRVFSSFRAFAAEAAISRLYGGIHFRSAIENGLEQGKVIGRNISAIDLYE